MPQSLFVVNGALMAGGWPRAAHAPPAGGLDIPLKDTFRYVQEPSPGDDIFASLGNDGLVTDLDVTVSRPDMIQQLD